jgi:hypothetical protein
MDCSTGTIRQDFQAQQEHLPRNGAQQEHLPRDGAQQEHLPRDGAQTETEEKVKLINGKFFLTVLCPEVGIDTCK